MPDGKIDQENGYQASPINTGVIQERYQDYGRLLLEPLERECKAVGISCQLTSETGLVKKGIGDSYAEGN